VFFNHFLHVQLLYRPFGKDASRDIKFLNELGRVLYKRVRRFSYRAMRDLVLRLIVEEVAPDSLQAAQAAIAAIPSRIPAVPSESIAGVNDERLRLLLLRLVKAEANRLRNRVVHKMPTGLPWRRLNAYTRKRVKFFSASRRGWHWVTTRRGTCERAVDESDVIIRSWTRATWKNY
jgi:hypothetical protein